jgi:plastocyanin
MVLALSVPHNVAIYTDASRSEAIFVGDTISDTQIVYEIPALDAGEYYFVCDLHPDMNGTGIAD